MWMDIQIQKTDTEKVRKNESGKVELMHSILDTALTLLLILGIGGIEPCLLSTCLLSSVPFKASFDSELPPIQKGESDLRPYHLQVEHTASQCLGDISSSH